MDVTCVNQSNDRGVIRIPVSRYQMDTTNSTTGSADLESRLRQLQECIIFSCIKSPHKLTEDPSFYRCAVHAELSHFSASNAERAAFANRREQPLPAQTLATTVFEQLEAWGNFSGTPENKLASFVILPDGRSQEGQERPKRNERRSEHFDVWPSLVISNSGK